MTAFAVTIALFANRSNHRPNISETHMTTEPVSVEGNTPPVSVPTTVQPTAQPAVQPWLLVVIAIVSVQLGAAIAKQLFEAIGFGGVVFLRTFLGGLIFAVITRSRWRGYSAHIYGYVVIYGAIIAVNMLAFYAAIERIPLGIAVAIAFAGPLVVSVLGSRRPIDFLWVVLAAVGILLLSPITDATLDPVGLLLAFVCSFAWASFIIVTKRAGNLLPGNTMLTLSMCMAAVVAAPFGAVRAAGILTNPSLLAIAILVAVLASVIPFGFEFVALKHLPPRTFGLLMSLEPAAAALMGWVILHEVLGVEKIVGIGLVVIAAAATTRSNAPAR
jgi:inner membrane transporter RhtA